MAERMIQIQSTLPKEKQEEAVDEELEAFSAWMGDKGGPLSRPERAIVKTYLAWKLGVANGS